MFGAPPRTRSSPTHRRGNLSYGTSRHMQRWCAMWTVPEVVRIDEPTTGDEEATLRGLLEWQRATLLWKCSGLTADELTMRSVRRRPCPYWD